MDTIQDGVGLMNIRLDFCLNILYNTIINNQMPQVVANNFRKGE